MGDDRPNSKSVKQIGPTLPSAHGLIAVVLTLAVAVGQLALLRGPDWRQFALFLAPPLLALLLAFHSRDQGICRLAIVFLVLIAMGSVIASFPVLFPRLGGIDKQLPRRVDRLLTWYTAVYLVFGFGVAPWFLFLQNLARHRRGEPAQISAPTCYAGLALSTLLGAILPGLLVQFLGFWPVI